MGRFLWKEEAHSIAVVQQQQKTYHPMHECLDIGSINNNFSYDRKFVEGV